MTAAPAGFVAVAGRTDIPELGVGILGYGFMGRAHTNAYKKIPYIYWPPAARPRLVAMSGRHADAVAVQAARYGYEGYYTDWRQMLADDRIQLFDNSGPHSMHVEPSLAALAAGKHVVCEKPMALNSADALRMVRAARDAGVKHMCGFNYRFIPAVRLARELIDRGALGKLYQFRCQYLQESLHDPDAPLRRAPDPAALKAGCLVNLGSHVIDMARFLMGEMRSVSALLPTFERTRRLPDGSPTRIEADEAFAALVEFESGAVGTIEASQVATGRKNRQYWELNGSRGTLVFDLERLNELQVYLDQGATAELQGFQDVLVTEAVHPFVKVWWPKGHILGWEHAHINELYHLVEAIALDKDVAPFGATFVDGYRVAVISDAITESATTGKRMTLQFEA